MSRVLLSNLKYLYSDIWEPVDSRLSTYPLLGGRGPPLSILTATAVYVYFAKVAGPKFMERRKPLDIKLLIFVYNVLMVTLNLTIFVRVALVTTFGLDTWGCSPFGRYASSDSDIVLECFTLGWLFYISKYVDWLDTPFFVARKKTDHLSTLHVLHHAAMPFLSWLGLIQVANMAVGFIPLANSLVHSCMYAYYALSVLGPNVQRRFIWWKRTVKTLQIVQIVLIAAHSVHFAFLPNCSNMYGSSFVALVVGFSLVNLYLFCAFFHRRYMFNVCGKMKQID